MVLQAPFKTPARSLAPRSDMLSPPLLKRKRTSADDELTLPSFDQECSPLPSSLFMPLALDNETPAFDLSPIAFLKPRMQKTNKPKRKSMSRSSLTDVKPFALSFDETIQAKRRRTSLSLAPVILQESRAQRRNSSAGCA